MKPPTRRPTLRRLARAGLALLLLAALAPAPGAHAAEPARAVDHPGYLDFAELGMSADADDVRVEVNLQDAVLAFVAETLRPSEPELAEALGKIRSIRFQLFQLTPADRAKAGTRARALADKLEKRGWQRVVRIQEDDTQSYLHLKMVGNRILGLTVMFLNRGDGEDKEGGFGFINLAGEIDPAQLGRIGQRFDIDVLEQAERELGGKSNGVKKDGKNGQ